MKKNKLKYVLLMTLSLTLGSFTAEADDSADRYTLEQVVIFSRHGLRAPLTTPSSSLGKLTTHQWPQWDTPPSYLTTRGGALESYFGHYVSEWLIDNKLIEEKTCPTDKDIYFYANSMQRTIATAQFFALGAFPGCMVPVYHKEAMNTMDDLFSLNIRDNSAAFKQQATQSIAQTAGEEGISSLNKSLAPVYADMEKIIGYQESTACKVDNQCNLMDLKASINITQGQEPGVTGPLRVGTSISDAFILQYYEGTPFNEIAWGQIKSQEEFEKLISIKEYYNSTVFGAPVIAKHVAKNLVSYIDDTFTKGKDKAKVTVLVGHDSNVASILSMLAIKPYQLPNQLETTPIGGKIFFERWKDNKTGKDLMKIEYVYQSTQQISQMQALTRENPPQKVTLEMAACQTDSDGFCDYQAFKSYLDASIQ